MVQRMKELEREDKVKAEVCNWINSEKNGGTTENQLTDSRCESRCHSGDRTEKTEGEIDPMNSPISEILKARADERRKKMKDFNYKFNNTKIDDMEKVPAYKRQGIDLDDTQHSSENSVSRTSVGTDDNDDIQLRSNNSFLHDNVD